MQRSYGARRPTRTEHLAAAKGYLTACARNGKQPSADTLVRSYGMKPAEAEALIAGRM